MTRETAIVRGWCPDAWRPMAAGDGLLVRVRPRFGRITRRQVLALCDAALSYGNGWIDLTNRSGLQLRGAREADWHRLLDALIDAGLVSPDPAVEARGLLVVEPGWTDGDPSHRIATALLARADDLPPLPAKMGFAVDAGPRPALTSVPADFRVERDARGGLMLRLDGRATGARLRDGDAAAKLIALAHWFVESGGAASGRAARHHAPLPAWADDGAQPATPAAHWQPGQHALGAVFGIAFGQIDARLLAALVSRSSTPAIRLTPWRMLLVEGVACEPAPGFITGADAAFMRIDACAGAPACPQATVETRSLAYRLAPLLGGRRLHLSGCAKGCARPHAAAIVATGRGGCFDLGFDARAADPPQVSGLSPDQLLAHLGER